MTVNYAFDLEDDDFFDATLRSIPENDLLSPRAPAIHAPNILTSNSETKEANCELSKDLSPGSNTIHSREGSSQSYSTETEKVYGKVKFKGEITYHEACNSKENLDRTSIINSRFVPGFTPKAKKRKFPGPAFFVTEEKESSLLLKPSDEPEKHIESEIEVQNITSSQFSADDLLLPSWQNLQADVSSRHSLLSCAKYYSIRRVLHETAKKSPPKHIVVPVLCVLIKKFIPKDSTLLFIDDTGEICGKIDKHVPNIYKDYIKDGTALILKKVTFLCNVLLLKEQSVVSVYLEDGSVRHIQDSNSMAGKEEPLKPMSCGCTGTPKKKVPGNNISHKNFNFRPITSVTSSISNETNTIVEAVPGPSGLRNSNSNSVERLPFLGSTFAKKSVPSLKLPSLASSPRTLNSTNLLKPKSTESFNNLSNISTNDKADVSIRRLTSTTTNSNQKMAIVAETKNAVSNCVGNISEAEDFCSEFETDDFDELLGSLDEKSFLDAM